MTTRTVEEYHSRFIAAQKQGRVCYVFGSAKGVPRMLCSNVRCGFWVFEQVCDHRTLNKPRAHRIDLVTLSVESDWWAGLATAHLEPEVL